MGNGKEQTQAGPARQLADPRARFALVVAAAGIGFILIAVSRILLESNHRFAWTPAGLAVLTIGLVIFVPCMLYAVLSLRRRSAASGAPRAGRAPLATKDVIYKTASWTPAVRATVNDAVSRQGITIRWGPGELWVARRDKAAVDQILAEAQQPAAD